jgi:alpha-tubulin suppressor-like RCC1 family protein
VKPALSLVMLLVAPGCHEDIRFIAGPDGAAAECVVCAEGGCNPAADGTICASGVCQAGDCVTTTCPGAQRWLAVAAGEAHSCAVGWSGALYCWGRNDEGQLGAGDLEPRGEPVAVDGDWIDAAAGWKHTCGLARDGAAACWGENNEGQVGSGAISPSEPAPRAVMDLPALRSVAGGQDHTCAVGVEGGLWCWGKNAENQLGAAEPPRADAPLAVDDGVDRVWRQVSAGGKHTCGTDLDGRLWCWGANMEGQLGTGGALPVATPAEVASGTGWVEVAAGANHTCAIDGGDHLWCWGDDKEGELGRGDGAEGDRVDEPAAVDAELGWRSVRVGDKTSCAIAIDGTLWCWGKNDAGQLGLGDTMRRSAPVRVGGADDWASVAVGKRHVCGVRTSGGLFCWGDNAAGQLNLGDLTEEEPTEVCGDDVE